MRFGSQAVACRSGGKYIFSLRSVLIRALKQESLSIQVQLRFLEQTARPSQPFVPENPLTKIMLKKFMHEEKFDVVLEVDGKTFYLHRFILEDCAPTLFRHCHIGTDLTPVRISGVKPDIFHCLLYYVHGGKLDDDKLTEHAKDIFDAADRFEVVNLKLEAEAVLVHSTTVISDNVKELLLYAVDKNCALLNLVLLYASPCVGYISDLS